MKNLVAKLVGSILLATLFAYFATPFGLTFTTPRTYAQNNLGASAAGGLAGCAAGALISSGLGSVVGSLGINVPIGDGEQTVRQHVLDCVVWVVNNIVVEQITADTVAWIQSGFDGNPAFIDDFGGFLEDVADETLGNFIEGTDLAFLCSPIQFDVKIALALKRPFREQVSCTLSDVVENIDDFYAGNFKSGGWKGWFHLATLPQNNPNGAYFLAKVELEERVRSKLGIEQEQLQWNRGFLSKTVPGECYTVYVTDPPEERCDPPRTVTPGTYAQDQLDESGNRFVRRLEIADEVNEIVSALVAFLVTDFLTNENGVLGVETAKLVTSEQTTNYDSAVCLATSPASTSLEQRDLTSGPWEVTATQPDLKIPVSNTNGSYNRAILSFDFYLDAFERNQNGGPLGQFQPLFHFLNEARGSQGPSCFFGAVINPNETIFNLCGNTTGPRTNDYWIKQPTNWTEGQWYTVTVTYEALSGTSLVVTDRTTGTVIAEVYGIPSNSIYSTGNGLRIVLGGNDPGSLTINQLVGSQFENVSLYMEPGETTACGGGTLPGNEV